VYSFDMILNDKNKELDSYEFNPINIQKDLLLH
jgi:hypothetical protein